LLGVRQTKTPPCHAHSPPRTARNRRTKNNPVLVGEPGVGKTAIAEGLAQRIVKNDVPSNLQVGWCVLGLACRSLWEGNREGACA
jgi:ATP-dependent Clp protease ATP-binding subunit ClpA